MLKTSGTMHKAKYAYKIHAWDVRPEEQALLLSHLPKRVRKISKHAKKRQREKGFRTSVKELQSLMTFANLLDIQVEDSGAYNFVFRASVNPLHDLTFVIKPDGHVVTFWVNDKRDQHSTLDESIYRKDISLKEVFKHG